MSSDFILSQRLASLQLATTQFKKPEQVAYWFGGMQAQDYAHSKWAIGIRLPGSTDAAVEKAIEDKKLVRTWLMRGTLHIAAARDINWILNLLAPRLMKAAAGRNRRLELDDKTFKKTNALLTRHLANGNQLTRAELAAIFDKAGIKTNSIRLAHILQRAVLEKLICQGSKQTFMLLDIPSETKTPDEALAELASRYFESHGPATLADFIWWSGLSATEAKQALQMISGRLKNISVEKHSYWLSDKAAEAKPKPGLYILPSFDEYIVGYKDRSLFLPTAYTRQVITVNGLFNPTIVIDGQVVGTWSRTIKNDTAAIQLQPFKTFTKKQREAIAEKASEYARFAGVSIKIQ